jgi:rod shape-determining protein MreD
MMDRWLVARWTALVLTVTVLQIGVAPDFRVAGVVPDLLCVLALSAGVAAGPQRGAIVGFWCGLLLDLMRPDHIGLSALAYCVCGALVGLMLVSLITVRRVLAALVVGLGSSAAMLLYGVANEISGGHALSMPASWRIIGYSGLIGAVLSVVMVPVARRVEGYFAIEQRDAVLGVD